MKFLPLLLLIFCCARPLEADWDSFTYFPPLEILYHPVSTTSKEAQEAFNRGLLALYAFNYDQALASFDRASQLDPDLAMAYWGMALTLDENIDPFSTPNRARLTHQLCEKALAAAKNATPQEQAFITALAKRFTLNYRADKKALRTAYSKAMEEVVRAYPDDPDASVLYAESLMDEMSWTLWTPREEPHERTLEVVSILESVLKSNPMHAGANHYYIHALEHSPYPERALMSAYRLDLLNPHEWGHLIHTASHIYMRVGLYDKAVDVNVRAIEADKEYIKKHGYEGRYPLKYLAHNMFYLTIAYMWQERFDKAYATAQELEKVVTPYIEQAPTMEFNLLMPYQVLLYFHRWEEILKLPEPPAKDGMVHPFWFFAQAMAYAWQENLEKADTALVFFQQKQKEYYALRNGGGAFARQLFGVAEHLLKAELQKLHGNYEKGLAHLRKAVEIQEEELGDFSWSYPICQTVGAYLIGMQHYKEAEAWFRRTLNRFPKNGRSLFGLSQALKFQGNWHYSIERECRDALRHAQKELTLSDL